jgi:uncharacterized membrane protein
MQRWTMPTRRTLVSACWATGITLATASYLSLSYSTLPDRLPVRYLRGEPVFFQLKTPIVVMLPALVQAALVLVFGALCLMLLWRARPDSGAAHTADHARMSVAVEAVSMLGAIWITVQAIGAARLVAVWEGGRGSFGRMYNITLVVSLVVSALVVWRTTGALRQQQHAPAPETNPDLWRFTHLYFNPQDPALFVPTRRGAGWTLNFGRPLAIVLIAAILTLGVGGPFALARSVLWDGAFVMFQVPAPRR